MRNERITRFQKRAKRRVLLLAILGAAFISYSALSLFGDENRSGNEQSNPVSRKVGIRLLVPANKNLDSKKESGTESGTTALPPPIGLPKPNGNEPTELPKQFVLPSTTPKSSVEAPAKETARPNFSFPLSLPSLSLQAPIATTPTQVRSTVAEITPPPKMSEVMSGKTQVSPQGAVIVKLKKDGLNPPVIDLEKPVNTHRPAEKRLALSGGNRVPELVKPKSTQITHTVKLAQSTDFNAGTQDIVTSQLDFMSKSGATNKAPIGVSHNVDVATTSKATAPNAIGANRSPSGSTSSLFLSPPPTLNNGVTTEPITNASTSKQPGLDKKLSDATPFAIIELESQSATVMDIPGVVQKVSAQDEEVCKVMHNERTVSLVGNKPGSTLVQIWTNEVKGPPQIVRVNVSQQWQKANFKPSDMSDVKSAIAQAFPKADIRILSNDDGVLEVRGTTDSEESAFRILEIVRKLCLVPVKDKVTVSR